MKCLFTIIFSLSIFVSFSQAQTIDSTPADGILLKSGWKFQPGDNVEWAKTDFNDRSWQSATLSDYNTYLPRLKSKNIGWFRLHLSIDSSVLKRQLAIQLSQLGASEIYLNGMLFQQFGSIKMHRNFKSYNPVNKPFLLPVDLGNSIVIAIRFASNVPSNTWLFTDENKLPLTLTVNSWANALLTYDANSKRAEDSIKLSYLSVASALLFVLIYVFFPREKINLLFATLSFFTVTASYLVYYSSQGSLDISSFGLISFLLRLNHIVVGILMVSIICQAILHQVPLYFKLLFLAMCTDAFVFLIYGPTHIESTLNIMCHVLFTVSFFYLSVLAFVKKNYILAIVAFNSWVLNVSFFLVFYHISLKYLYTLTFYDYARYTVTANFVLITVYLAMNFARRSKKLEVQLIEIKKLSDDNLKKELEKQQLLAAQNETLERQVAERTSALHKSFEELKSTQAQLVQSEKMASLGQLTAGIAHEIQNPLNFVNNFSEINTELIAELKEEIDRGDLEEVKAIASDIEENEQKIVHHGKRADSIVKGMLQHSRASTGKRELTDINALIDECVRLSYHGMRAKDKEFTADVKTNLDDNIGKIDVVPQDISRVLINLVNNAFYAVDEKKRQMNGMYEPAVSVCTKKLDGKVEVYVKDNGNGIPQSVIDKIFQPFFTTKPTGQGTGLGLSLSYDIVKAHGGEIKVSSNYGNFTEFVVQLPILHAS